MGETTVGHVAGEVVRALYGAGYMESTIGQYRKSIEGVGTVRRRPGCGVHAWVGRGVRRVDLQ